MRFKLKQKLRAGDDAIGMMVYMPTPTAIEILGYSGYDFVIIDTEHTTNGTGSELAALLRAALGVGLSALVRVKSSGDLNIPLALEAGAEGILLPHAQSQVDAESVVAAVKFPPLGHRGYASVVKGSNYGINVLPRDFVMRTNEQTLVILMAEDEVFFDRLDDILSVPGVDGLFLGSADYVVSRGVMPNEAEASHLIKHAKDRLEQLCASRDLVLVTGDARRRENVSATLAPRVGRMVLVEADIAVFKRHCADAMNLWRSAVSD